MIKEERIKELTEEMRNVPFGNSVFQIEAFIANEKTKERCYRTCLLQVDQKMQALQKAKFGRDRTLLDIEELESKVASLNPSGFEARRMEIDIQEKKYDLEKHVKLIEDAMIEVAAYVRILDQIPKFTRDEFETAELGYWRTRLLAEGETQVKCLGYMKDDTAMTLAKVGILTYRDEKTGQLMGVTNDKTPEPKLKAVTE